MAGSLPGEAILHARQLTLLSMICRLPGDPLHAHALYVLSCSPPSAKSWFQQVRDICLLYSLPHPLELLQHPPTKFSFKNLVKRKVTQYWENLLRTETLHLSSLIFFNSTQLSLQKPCFLWRSAGSNSFECSKSLIVGKMVSGRYRSDYLCRHWTPANKQGYCLEDTCNEVVGDLVHMLGVCPALQAVRKRLIRFWFDKSAATPALFSFISEIVCSPPHDLTQFILDPCQFSAILAMMNTLGLDIINHIFYLTRTFAYYMHREKMLLLGRWPGDPGRKPKPISKLKTKRLSKNDSEYPDQNTNCSVTGSTAPPISVSYPTTPATTTTNSTGTTGHGCHTSALSYHSLTTLSTDVMHTTRTTPMPGLVTCVGCQQHTAGQSEVPHTADHAAHHSVGDGERKTAVGGGSDVIAPTGSLPNVSYALSSGAHSISITRRRVR